MVSTKTKENDNYVIIAPLREDVVPAGLISELEALAVDHLSVEVAFSVCKPTIRVTPCSDRQHKQRCSE